VRRSLLALTPALLALLVLPGGASAAHRCARKGSETVRGTHKVRVYSTEDGKLFGCVRATGVTRHLYGQSGNPAPNELDHYERVRIAGYHVALVTFALCTVCGDGPSSGILEFELRSGERRALSHVRKVPEGSYDGTEVDALVLDRCGRIAYRAVVADMSGPNDDAPPELHTWVGKHHPRIDSGAIERRSIRLRPESVHWRRDGVERSAPLAPACP
jgi:hypothetical protein